MKTLLLDMDGVITSERIYWDCAGLTVAKLLAERDSRDFPSGRKERTGLAKSCVPDSLTRKVKSVGVGNNWDLTYIVAVLRLHNHNPEKFLDDMLERGLRGFAYLDFFGEFDPCLRKYRKKGALWERCLQEFGQFYKELRGDERPVIPLWKIKHALCELKKSFRLCIVTGRPYDEIIWPMTKWELLGYFDASAIVTDREVKAAQAKLRLLGIDCELAKPHPFQYMAAIEGEKAIEDVIKGDYKLASASEYIIIGDSVADALAAKAIGVKMIGVLTGASTKKELEAAGASLVVKDFSCAQKALNSLIAKDKLSK